MLTNVTPDHVAIAVPALDPAMPRWAGILGGEVAGWFSGTAFRTRQLRYPGGVKIELITPHERDDSDDNFVRRFLQRSGATVHHITLKIPDLHAAIDEAAAAGFDVVDVDDRDPLWKECFLRPSQIGGAVVQLAESNETDAEWAARLGLDLDEPKANAAQIDGPILVTTDLAIAGAVWEQLGAAVTSTSQGLVASWSTAALRVHLVEGVAAGGRGIACQGRRVMPQDPVLGAALLPTPAP